MIYGGTFGLIAGNLAVDCFFFSNSTPRARIVNDEAFTMVEPRANKLLSQNKFEAWGAVYGRRDVTVFRTLGLADLTTGQENEDHRAGPGDVFRS
jgi:hypothetical protein